MMDFFAMGGYAAFVWPTYGIAAIILIGLGLSIARSMKKNEAELAQLLAARKDRRAAQSAEKDDPPASETMETQ